MGEKLPQTTEVWGVGKIDTTEKAEQPEGKKKPLQPARPKKKAQPRQKKISFTPGQKTTNPGGKNK